VQLSHLALADALGRITGLKERVRHPLDRLALPGRYHRVMEAVLGGELRQRQVTPDRLQRYLGLEIRSCVRRRLTSRSAGFAASACMTALATPQIEESQPLQITPKAA
jgi:hypothetical protein